MLDDPISFDFDSRPSDSGLVETIWRTRSEGGGAMISLAESHWGLVITRQYGQTTLTVRGPETRATPAPVPENAEFFGIIFKLGTFMPHLPVSHLVDSELTLPEAASRSVWLAGSAWELPTYDNADTFVHWLMREGLIGCDPIVEAVLQGRSPDVSIRTVRRRFLQTTGLPYKTIQQIERAHQAAALLGQGVSILDTVYETDYFDQPHLTRALKYLLGQTPTQIARQADERLAVR